MHLAVVRIRDSERSAQPRPINEDPELVRLIRHLRSFAPSSTCEVLAVRGSYGVVTERFSYLLEGEGRTFGIKFRPGAFYSFVRSPLSGLTDRSSTWADIFGEAGRAAEEALLAEGDHARAVRIAEAFLLSRNPIYDEDAELAGRIVSEIIADRSIGRLETLAKRFGKSARTLQRLFRVYVGVSPKWVILRYRLQEAIERIRKNIAVDWCQLALELGYSDQPHFIKAFKAIVGKTPTDYAKWLRNI